MLHVNSMKLKKLNYILFNVIVVILFFVIVEISIVFLLSKPAYIPSSLISIFREYYMFHDREFIQYKTETAVYDSTLYYKLKPGHFRFSSREFDTDFDVNKLGVRDDEESLDCPFAILLGDSHAMGWGVEQDHTFASIIETELKFSLLNAAVSSYGTAREFKLLDQLNTRCLQYLIVQYCPNDYEENKSFSENNNQLRISSRESYDDICLAHAKSSRYYPFKHLVEISSIAGSRIRGRLKDNNIPEEVAVDEASFFMNVLAHSKSLAEQVKIILFSINSRNSEADFIEGIKKELNKEEYSTYQDRIILLDFSSSLTKNEYYILDDHLNKAGQQVVANTIMEAIQSDISKSKN